MFFAIIFGLILELASPNRQAHVKGSDETSIASSPPVAACSTWFASRTSSSAPATLRTSPESFCFDGVIDPTGAAKFIAAMNSGRAGRPALVVVRSGGGGISESLDVAEALVGRDVTVAVHTLCGSGCANGIFLPARRRIILDDGIVAFHGGASLTLVEKVENERENIRAAVPGVDMDRLSAEWRIKLKRDIARQDAMLRASGIDGDFFVWFDRMAIQPASRQSPDCAANAHAQAIVFSQEFLRRRKVEISYNGGPRSAEDLRRLNARRGWGNSSCFWR
jgi:hypothetical protein